MKSAMMKLDWANVKSIIIYGLLTMFLVFLLAVVEGIIAHGSIFGVDWKHVVDTGSIKSLGIFVMVVSLIKNLLTTESGKFLGAVTVIPDKTEE